ncbi:MAG: hypothetical protein IPK66_13205 [Rhodospirillales bacterium]|nr:hypothetical protein [Rhodospirillales bacterium]
MTFDIESLKADIPADILAMLGDAESPYSQFERAERALQAAVERAPDSLALRMATYSFYYYANRLQEAIPHAEACLAIAAGALGLPGDWRLVSPDSACFGALERPQRVYLKSLVALGYCRARLGDREGGAELLRKAASLDPQDQIGAAPLADLVAHGGMRDEDDED